MQELRFVDVIGDGFVDDSVDVYADGCMDSMGFHGAHEFLWNPSISMESMVAFSRLSSRAFKEKNLQVD